MDKPGKASNEQQQPFRRGKWHPQQVENIDEYVTETYRWWHLSQLSPELRAALDEMWLVPPGQVLDLGCGLGTELAFMAHRGFTAIGVDLSPVALARARAYCPDVRFVQADVLNLPFTSGTFDVLLDRGCFHYVPLHSREQYEQEAHRMLRPGGHLLLRACLRSEGARNDIDEGTLVQTFARWRVALLARGEIPTDTRRLDALVARLERL
jgi:SAM-dependent methyltransferase